jgi:hypothetical protein
MLSIMLVLTFVNEPMTLSFGCGSTSGLCATERRAEMLACPTQERPEAAARGLQFQPEAAFRTMWREWCATGGTPARARASARPNARLELSGLRA